MNSVSTHFQKFMLRLKTISTIILPLKHFDFVQGVCGIKSWEFTAPWIPISFCIESTNRIISMLTMEPVCLQVCENSQIIIAAAFTMRLGISCKQFKCSRPKSRIVCYVYSWKLLNTPRFYFVLGNDPAQMVSPFWGLISRNNIYQQSRFTMVHEPLTELQPGA